MWESASLRVLVVGDPPLLVDALASALAAGPLVVVDECPLDCVVVLGDRLDAMSLTALRAVRLDHCSRVVACVRTASAATAIAARRSGIDLLSIVASVDDVRHAARHGTANDVRLQPVPSAAPLLSDRELDVLGQLGEGWTPQQIARRLGISLHTCRDHVKAIRKAFDVTTTMQAVLVAARNGLVAGLGPVDDPPD